MVLMFLICSGITGMPHLETHVQWVVDFFGTHCSGLALHSDVWSLGRPKAINHQQ
jgi:hypothetical protein